MAQLRYAAQSLDALRPGHLPPKVTACPCDLQNGDDRVLLA